MSLRLSTSTASDMRFSEKSPAVFLAGLFASMLMLVLPASAFAAWVEVGGTVEQIVTYTHTDTVLVKLSSSGPNGGLCTDGALFAIDGAVPADRRKQMLAMLASSQARGAVVVLTYSDSGGCVPWDGNSNVYRGIIRLRTM